MEKAISICGCMLDKDTEMTLDTGDHFTLNDTTPGSLFSGLNIFVRNNGINLVKVSTDGSNILITVEKKAP